MDLGLPLPDIHREDTGGHPIVPSGLCSCVGCIVGPMVLPLAGVGRGLGGLRQIDSASHLARNVLGWEHQGYDGAKWFLQKSNL